MVKQHAPITGEQIAKPKVGYFPGPQMAPEGFASRKLSSLKVKDVQAMPVIIRETTSVHDAVVTLFLEDVGGLIVANEEGSLTGVISRKDLLKFTLGNSAAGTMPVSLVMTRQPNIIYVSPEDSVLDAARKMILHQVDSVPVVTVQKDEAGQDKLEVVGRMTKTTMTKVLLELAVQSDI
jgi:CBS domain-containing protein